MPFPALISDDVRALIRGSILTNYTYQRSLVMGELSKESEFPGGVASKDLSSWRALGAKESAARLGDPVHDPALRAGVEERVVGDRVGVDAARPHLVEHREAAVRLLLVREALQDLFPKP